MNALSKPCARIFLLSHMRAYTSLAGHILGSHPQINGYYEMHSGMRVVSALERVARYRDPIKANVAEYALFHSCGNCL